MSLVSLALLAIVNAPAQAGSQTWNACFDGNAPTAEAYVAFREAGHRFREAGQFGALVTLSGPDLAEAGWSEPRLTAYVELLRAGVAANYLTIKSEDSQSSQCLSVTVDIVPPAQNPPRLWHLSPIYGFEPGSAELRSFNARAVVRIAAAGYATGWLFRVDGHTDTVGSTEDNLALSRRRAEAVAVALVREGVPWEDIEINGHGEARLARPTADETPEPLNRQVTINMWRRPATPR
jgi:outer membrane protein OmpA-like peptidoglycan-associated protein